MSLDAQSFEYKKKELPSGIFNLGAALTLIGIVAFILGYLTDPTRSVFNNVIVLMFLISIGLGSLFLVGIEYLSGAVWSTPFRRIPEILAGLLLVAVIVSIPALLNLHDLFHWMHPEAVETDKILHGKAPYLNETFFFIRVAAFFAIWLLFYFLITRNSKKQDETKDQGLTRKNIRLSAVFMPFFAITVTFTAIDWMMSLEPHWFSTIYGVYYFSGTFLCAISVTTFILINLSEKGYLFKQINSDHYYSFGALIFGFLNFWAYIAFSQFLLIWYANLPEETIWFAQRWHGPWMYVSILLVIVHFVVPYFGMLSQPSKMNPKNLKFFSVWMIFAHILDLYWLIMPTYSPDSLPLGWIEIGFIAFAIGIVILFFAVKAKKTNLMPIGDPKLLRGINFHL